MNQRPLARIRAFKRTLRFIGNFGLEDNIKKLATTERLLIAIYMEPSF